jgi:hypothetical protein
MDATEESFTPTVSGFDMPASSDPEQEGKPSAPSLFKRDQLLSELEPQYAGQAAEAHGVRDDDNVVLENAVKHPRPHAGGKNAEHQGGDRSPALPVCQHFFSWGKYDIEVQKAAKNPTRVVVSIAKMNVHTS